MTHYLNLRPQPFSMIASGRKTIELRLWDEKRQRIAVGDTLIFTNTFDSGATLHCLVKALHIFKDFAELYRNLPLEQCGYLPEEVATATSEDMNEYYAPEKQSQYGVVGIELELISE